MPLDGLTLGFVCRELDGILVGGRVDRVQQPERDELHLIIRSQGVNHRLLLCAGAHHARLHLARDGKTNPMEPPMFCMLLRKLLMGGRVSAVRQIGGDRIAEIDIDALDELGDQRTRTLVIEIMGRHSNIILRDHEGRIVDAIRHVSGDMSRVREVLPGLPYATPSAQGKLNPATATVADLHAALTERAGRLDQALLDSVAGLSPQAAQELSYRLLGDTHAPFAAEHAPQLAERLHALLASLPEEKPPILLLNEAEEPVDVYPLPQRRFAPEQQREVPQGISAALDAFYCARDNRERMSQRTQSLAKSLKTHIERCEKKLALQQEAIEAGQRAEQWRIYGELLTAHLHLIAKGASSTTVPNFYAEDSAPVTIPLDVQISPAQNAQRYFKRYQKARAGQKMATEQLGKTLTEKDWLEAQLDDLRKCEDDTEVSEIRALLVEGGYLRASHSRVKPRKLPPSKPFCYRSGDGMRIYVGKNSAQNDRLTAAADGGYTWLHAKDMPGSHVLIAHAEPIPEPTLRDAAMLAAYYSKGARSSRVPVDYTLRKYVKKPGGSPLGYVIYTNQKTLFVTPDEAHIKKLEVLGGEQAE